MSKPVVIKTTRKAYISGHQRTVDGVEQTVAPHMDSRTERVDTAPTPDIQAPQMPTILAPFQRKLLGEKETPAPPPAPINPEADYARNGTRAQSFKNWFGDWERRKKGEHSTVLDASGMPRIMYPAPGAMIADAGGHPAVFGDLAKKFPAYHFTEVQPPQTAPQMEDNVVPEEIRHPLMDHATAMMQEAQLPPLDDTRQALFLQTGDLRTLYPARRGDPFWLNLQGLAADLASKPAPAVWLNVRNPFKAEEGLHPDDLDSMTRQDPPLLAATKQRVQERTGASEKTWTKQANGMDVLNAFHDIGRTHHIPSVLQSGGYDGIQHTHPGPDGPEARMIAFMPNQVKAQENIGTFLPHEEDIYKALQPTTYEPGGKFHGIVKEVTQIHPDELIPLNPRELGGSVYNQEESGLDPEAWAKTVDLTEPVDASIYSDGTIRIQDGHHRYLAAKTLGKMLNVNLQAVNAKNDALNALIQRTNAQLSKALPGGAADAPKEPEPFKIPGPAGGFYLNSERILRSTMGKQMPAQQLQGQLKALPKEELHYTGIGQHLEDKTAAGEKVQRHEILQHIQDNMPKIGILRSEFRGKEGDFPSQGLRRRYTAIQNPEDYQEHLFTAPGFESYKEDDHIHFGPEGQGKGLFWLRTHDAGNGLHIEEIQSKRHQDGSKKGYAEAGTTTQTDNSERQRKHEEHADLVRRMAPARDALKEEWKAHPELYSHPEITAPGNGINGGHVSWKRNDEGLWYLNHTYTPHKDEDLEKHVGPYFAAAMRHIANSDDYTPDERNNGGINAIAAMAHLSDHHKQMVENYQNDRRRQEMLERELMISNSKERDKVPDAPLKDNHWLELGLKYALLHAAEQGHENLSWNDARMQESIYKGMVDDETRKTFEKRYGAIGDADFDLDDDGELSGGTPQMTRQGEIHRWLEKFGKRYGVAPTIKDVRVKPPRASVEHHARSHWVEQLDPNDHYDEELDSYIHPTTGQIFSDPDEFEPRHFATEEDDMSEPEERRYFDTWSEANNYADERREGDIDDLVGHYTRYRPAFHFPITEEMREDLKRDGLPLWGNPVQVKKAVVVVGLKRFAAYLRKAVKVHTLDADRSPTSAQIEAGNYRMGHINWHGLEISIENPKGSTRRGVDRNGKAWSVRLKHHYGYIRRFGMGRDGDPVDVIVGRHASSDRVYIVDQVSPHTGAFDEHKVLVGFPTEEEAKAGYLANYSPGWKGFGAITTLSLPAFKAWLKGGGAKEPVALKEAV